MMTLRRILTPLVLLLAVTAGSAQPASAQPGLAYASATAAAVTDPVQPGATVKTILAVKVSPGFHIQSDKPRDPSLIPLTLMFEAPPGVKVEGWSFPRRRTSSSRAPTNRSPYSRGRSRLRSGWLSPRTMRRER